MVENDGPLEIFHPERPLFRPRRQHEAVERVMVVERQIVPEREWAGQSVPNKRPRCRTNFRRLATKWRSLRFRI